MTTPGGLSSAPDPEEWAPSVDSEIEDSTTSESQRDDGPTNIDDGRSLRRRRNRDAVISSLIALIREGDLEPSVASIADRAGVSHRSVFRYFDDLGDLTRTAIETEIRDSIPLAVIPGVGEGPFDRRVDAMLASRMRILPRTNRLVRDARAQSNRLPEVDRSIAMVSQMVRDQILRHFKTEFDEMDPETAEQVASLLSASMGFEGYDHQRRMLERTDDEIVEAGRLLLRRMLG